MTNRRHTFFSTVLTCCVLAVPALAQPGKGMPRYDVSTETTVTGTVERVDEVEGRHGWTGIHLQLKAGEKRYEIHMGPAFYLEEKGYEVKVGEELEALGSRFTDDDGEALIARKVTQGEEALTLRDEDGRPLWRRGRSRVPGLNR